MDIRIHCAKSAQRNVKKSKHILARHCAAAEKVLAANPEYGLRIPQFNVLRKMRLHIPELKTGKAGGYRAIYRAQIIDETCYILFLAVWFKGDKEDLSTVEYEKLIGESDSIYADVMSFTWDDYISPHF